MFSNVKVTLDHHDKFDELSEVSQEGVFHLALTGLPETIQLHGKEVDGDNYSEDCFGLWVNYEGSEGYFVEDNVEMGTVLYYVKNDGEKQYIHLSTDILGSLLNTVVEQINELPEVKDIGVIVTTT